MKFFIKIYFIGLLGLGLALMMSCRKDTGNYNYIKINEAIVSNLDSLYIVNRGEILNINPKISYSLDPTGDTVNYIYEWLLTKKEGSEAIVPKLLTSGPVFNSKIDLLTGVYNMLYRITDKRTGVWKEYPFQLFVTLRTYEGWLLLSEINGQKSRLDMMSYKIRSNDYEQIHDVLAEMKSGFKLTGLPNFVCYNKEMGSGVNQTNEKILISTTKEAGFLRGDIFDYHPINAFSNYMNGPDKATDKGAKLEGEAWIAYMTINGSIYYSGWTLKFSRISKISTSGKLFKAAPFISFSDNQAIAFDEENSRFLWSPTESFEFYTYNNIPALNNMNKQMLFMTRTKYNGGETFAILKDKTNSKIYLARLTYTKLNYLQEITDPNIAQAENFAVNSDYGYIFYNVGGVIYEYDFTLKLSKKMADYGNRKISMLKFQSINTGTTINQERYSKISNQLIVCSYDESNLDNSGTMDLYDVPAINGQITKVETFTGLGKVVSITYRTR